jgi:signal transduction histidine kinase
VRQRAKILTGAATRVNDQLRHLYEISKQLTRFESIERSVPQVLSLLSESVPLRIAILMLEQETPATNHTRAILWHAEGVTEAELRAAKAHARTAYGYVVRASTEVEDIPGSRRLPSTLPPSSETRKTGFVLLPLVVEHSQVFGALQIQGERALDEPDLMFLNAVVNQLAIALDRVAVIESKQAEAESGRVVAEFLSTASEILFSSSEYERTIAAVVRAAVPPLADVCFIDEVVDEGWVERVVVVLANGEERVADPIRRFVPAVDSNTPQAQVIRTGASMLLESVAGASLDRASAELLDHLGAQSLMTVPLVAHRRTLGALTFVTTEPGRPYTANDLTLAEEIGRRAAIAIDNAKLYQKIQRASQARQDLLAVVSHDLRNPLNVILMSAALLLDIPASDTSGWRKRVEVIQRSAHRMNRLISDLLDIASIDVGRLAIDLERHPVAPILREAVEAQQFPAAQNGVRLEHAVVDRELEVDCDRGRVLQILGNLLGNAVKFTPRGGKVTVRAEQRDEHALFSVNDTGAGISADELPRVFDRYWQASKTARLGSGLGLSIARGFVEAHGGRIWVESVLGEGSSFFFTLPLARAAAT